MLKNESIIYQYLQNTKGIPQVKWFGKDADNYYMVLNLLGQSLQTLKDKQQQNQHNFSLKLTLQIGIQVIHLLKTIHDKGLIHRDIKPDNFLFGLNDDRLQLYLIDFGFCKTYLDYERHMDPKKINGLIGSITYASINAHCFNEQSRRDDLESVGYMLLYLYLGKLEWQENDFLHLNNHKSFEDKNKLIYEMKERIIHNNDNNNDNKTTKSKTPSVLIEYLKYVRTLDFKESPDYFYLIQILKSEIEKTNNNL
jgi:serine/threonine protein kinase